MSDDPAAKRDLSFSSPRDLARMLDQLGLGLHAKNRMTGESNYYWHVAELIRNVGKLCTAKQDNSALEAEFGNGYLTGTLGKDEQLTRVLDMLRAVSKP